MSAALDESSTDAVRAFVDRSILTTAAARAKRQRRSSRRLDAEHQVGDRPAKPVIRLSAGRVDRIATEIEDVLIESGLPIFQRGSSLVRPVTFEVPAARNQLTISAGLATLTQPAMVDLYSQAADWVKYDKRAEDWLVADPSPMVAAVHLSRVGFWRLSPIAGVISTPTLRPDGSVLLTPGYDAATRLYYVPDPTLRLPEMPKHPTREDAVQAVGMLLDLLSGFPFTSDVSKSVALSMLITPVIRGALSVVPLHAAKANTAGTGKSYLVDLASSINTGRPCPVAAAGQNGEETEKRLVGLLLSAFPIVSLDNVNGELSGDVLCQAVERPLIRVRPLGSSEIIEIESRACIYATGNNLRVAGDMVRRTLLAVLDANMERPELRQFTSDPVATVLANRGRYVAACLTIARAYAAAGSPRQMVPLASFEDWSNTVRSALVWLGFEDPCISMEEAREDDPELTDMRMLMTGWHDAFGTDAMTVRKAVDGAVTPIAQADEHGDVPLHGATLGTPHPELRDAFLQLAGVRGVVDPARLGRWLMNHEGRIASTESFPKGLRFTRAGKTDGSVRWRLGPAGR